MLLELQLCYEQDPGNPNTLLLVPAILEESKEGTQRWHLTMPECRYIGRRLECKDNHMFITSDFFPKLQVKHFQDYYQCFQSDMHVVWMYVLIAPEI
jgi:hypothetical protein